MVFDYNMTSIILTGIPKAVIEKVRMKLRELTIVFLSIILTSLLIAAQAQAQSISCSVQLGTEGDPCTTLQQHPWTGPTCTFYPVAYAEVKLDVVDGKGTGSITYEGQTDPLFCSNPYPYHGYFTCKSPENFVVYGTPQVGVAVGTNDDTLQGFQSGCL
jgi:hypothetical protein